MPEEGQMRLTPYDLAFGRDGLDDRLFPPIAEEADARGLPLHEPERFLFLGSVGQLLRAVAGGGEEGAGAEDAPRGEMGEEMLQHGRLLYHAFHHWRAGRHTLAMDEVSLRGLLNGQGQVHEAAPAGRPYGDWRLRTPYPAGYLQLPPNLVWAAHAEGMRPEPVDGFFWTLLREGPLALHLLLALGVREDRPGFSVIPATGIPDTEPHWAEVDGRPAGTDFETTLPGGEMERLYSIETAAEILKLASLCFWRLDPAGG